MFDVAHKKTAVSQGPREEDHMKRHLLAASLVLAGTQGAHALDGPLYSLLPNEIGDCSVEFFIYPQIDHARVEVVDPSPSERRYAPAGGSWNYNSWSTSSPAITSAVIENCLGVTAGSVTNLSSFGGTSGSLAAEDRLGFSYDYAGRSYEFSLTGATNSRSNASSRVANTTPATELSAESEVVNQIITADASRSLTSVIFTNLRMTREARYRFVSNLGSAANASVSDVPVQIDGAFDATTTTLSSKGTFFGQADLNGGARRLVFGDFDIQHDSETGSSTATLNGKVAWEQTVSNKTLLGYFIGGELARSNIAGSFDGDQNRIGVSAGGYAVHEIAQQVYVEGFFSLGAGRNNLTMSNGVLDLDSDYTTRTATMGAAVSGVIEQQGFDILPELSLSFGRTWIGDVGFTGAAHSLVDNTLSLDAGTVTLANILFRPEFRVPMDGLSGAESLQIITFAPRLSCEQITTDVTEENCGAGAEFGFSGSSVDGLSSVSAKIMADRLGDRTTSSVQLNLQHRF